MVDEFVSEYGHRLRQVIGWEGIDPGQRRKKIKELADHLGNSTQAVKKLLDPSSKAGATKEFSAKNHAKTARLYGVDAYWLATGEGEPRAGDLPMRKERDTLSVEAVKHAMAFDRLSDGGKRTWRTVLMTVRSAVSDEHVERTVPLPPADDPQFVYDKRNQEAPFVPGQAYSGPERRKVGRDEIIGNVGPYPGEKKRVGNKNQ